MKNRLILLLLVFGMLFVSCKKEQTMQEYLTDSWQTSYLKIEMPTASNTDSLSVYEDKFDNNPDRIAQSKYNADGTFSAWFINKEGVKDSESTGTWSVLNDTLHIAYFYLGRNVVVNYKITKTNEGFDAESIYDWDDDGENDDTLLMKTKRIKLE